MKFYKFTYENYYITFKNSYIIINPENYVSEMIFKINKPFNVDVKDSWGKVEKISILQLPYYRIFRRFYYCTFRPMIRKPWKTIKKILA